MHACPMRGCCISIYDSGIVKPPGIEGLCFTSELVIAQLRLVVSV